MVQKEDFEQRLEELNWTLYRLAKEFAEYRAVEGDVSPASRYHSSISKAIENPSKSRLETIEDIVQVLNGKLTILWEPGKVVTIRLEDEIIEALKQRSENEGTTINEIAKQLLLQALSGFPTQNLKKLTNLVIAEEAKIYLSFHPLIASAYSAVHQWLIERPEAKGYKDLDYSKDISQSLDKTDLKSTAFQFYTLFHRHYFEAVHILDNVIHSTRLLNRIKYNPRIYLVDVGCAMGAATAAFIEKILTLPKEEIQSKTIEIVCVGIEPTIYGYAIYKKFMQELQDNIKPFNITLDFKAINEPLSQAILSTISHLKSKLNGWNSSEKILPHLFLMQLDVASSIGKDDTLKIERDQKLKALGLEPDFETEIDKEFWQDEALSFKRLLEEVPVENLHLMTISTKNIEKYLKGIIKINDISEGVKAISEAVEKFIGKDHRISVVLKGQQEVHFENPVDSYWQEHHQLTHSDKFYATFETIKSREIQEDNEWNKLISLENIELAWVKARNNLFNESFYDEIEIRLFENNLDKNFQILVENLIDRLYSENLLPQNQNIDYKFVKGRTKGRPKQLTRLEEEILAIAILNTIGKNLNFDSYRLTAEPTEDLYEDYFTQYFNDFLTQAGKSAESYPEGVVLRTDIQSYYVKVVHKQLLEITERELQISSQRIKWLLSKIIEQDLDGHENGKGLKQGTITSGFYANLYLKSIDDYFQNDKQWKDILKFHRYVDDIIIVLRNGVYLEQVESELRKKLSNLKLDLNEDKTERYNEIDDFRATIIKDEYLSKLNEQFNFTLYPLWIMNYSYRTQFEFANSSNNASLWWQCIKFYQQCLYSIDIYVTEITLSRKIYQKLVAQKINKNKELNLPRFIGSENFVIISNWAKHFQVLNADWIAKNNELKAKIVIIFKENLKDLLEILQYLEQTSNSISEKERREFNVKLRQSGSRLRWAVKKLIILGFEQVWQELVRLICHPNLFVIRDLLDVMVGLARQGYTDAIKQLWEHYQNSQIAPEETSQYLRAVILEAFRFLPILEQHNWQLIFQCSTEGKSDIEKLKATETWLYLGDLAKPFVQSQHLQAIIKALESVPPPFTRLKKNYILILGMYNSELLDHIQISSEEKNDYLIKDALKLSEKGKVSELFKEVEPIRVRQYYNLKHVPITKDKSDYSLS